MEASRIIDWPAVVLAIALLVAIVIMYAVHAWKRVCEADLGGEVVDKLADEDDHHRITAHTACACGRLYVAYKDGTMGEVTPWTLPRMPAQRGLNRQRRSYDSEPLPLIDTGALGAGEIRGAGAMAQQCSNAKT